MEAFTSSSSGYYEALPHGADVGYTQPPPGDESIDAPQNVLDDPFDLNQQYQLNQLGSYQRSIREFQVGPIGDGSIFFDQSHGSHNYGPGTNIHPPLNQSWDYYAPQFQVDPRDYHQPSLAYYNDPYESQHTHEPVGNTQSFFRQYGDGHGSQHHNEPTDNLLSVFEENYDQHDGQYQNRLVGNAEPTSSKYSAPHEADDGPDPFDDPFFLLYHGNSTEDHIDELPQELFQPGDQHEILRALVPQQQIPQATSPQAVIQQHQSPQHQSTQQQSPQFVPPQNQPYQAVDQPPEAKITKPRPKYTTAEEHVIRTMRLEGAKFSEIAQRLGRETGAVALKFGRMTGRIGDAHAATKRRRARRT